MVFAENIYDGDTLKPQLRQIERLINRMPLFEKKYRDFSRRLVILN